MTRWIVMSKAKLNGENEHAKHKFCSCNAGIFYAMVQ